MWTREFLLFFSCFRLSSEEQCCLTAFGIFISAEETQLFLSALPPPPRGILDALFVGGGGVKVFILWLTKEKYRSLELSTANKCLEVRKVINIQPPQKTKKKIAKLESDVEGNVALVLTLTLPPRLRLFTFPVSLVCADLKIYISMMQNKKEEKSYSGAFQTYGSFVCESSKLRLKVSKLEPHQAQQTVDRRAWTAAFEGSSLLGWKWISQRHNGSLRRVCGAALKPCLLRPASFMPSGACGRQLLHAAFLIATASPALAAAARLPSKAGINLQHSELVQLRHMCVACGINSQGHKAVSLSAFGGVMEGFGGASSGWMTPPEGRSGTAAIKNTKQCDISGWCKLTKQD